jgi:coenzyme F420 hydrogenase subunit beta
VSRSIQNLKDVVDWGLCIGCGACAYACKKKHISLVNVESQGIRPRFESDECAVCTECLAYCPGYTVDSYLAAGPLPKQTEADHEFGPALEIWEGYASDPEIRFRGSSGGLLSALSLYCIEKEGMAFVLHAGADPEVPWSNKTYQSRNRTEILSRTGSRYAPASPCDGLVAIEQSDKPCVFIGKPCDTAGVALASRQRPALRKNVGLVLSFFCAGTPSSRGTLDLIRSLDFEPENVGSVQYRGEGWPGRFRVSEKQGGREGSYSYDESWGRLTSYRPVRCHICPDGLGRVGDISCGDAWDEFSDASNDAGRSLVLVRTERGRQILRRAREACYVVLKPRNASGVMAAQTNLLARRREIFGRLLARRFLLMPVPKLIGFSLFRSWRKIPFSSQCRSIVGSMVRLMQRGLWRRREIFGGRSNRIARRQENFG